MGGEKGWIMERIVEKGEEEKMGEGKVGEGESRLREGEGGRD